MRALRFLRLPIRYYVRMPKGTYHCARCGGLLGWPHPSIMEEGLWIGDGKGGLKPAPPHTCPQDEAMLKRRNAE